MIRRGLISRIGIKIIVVVGEQSEKLWMEKQFFTPHLVLLEYTNVA